MKAAPERGQLAESRARLWLLVAAPLVWAVHFLFLYALAAVWCAKYATASGSPEAFRTILAVSSVAALAAIGIVGRSGWSRHRFGDATLPHDFDSPDDRHRFLGFATVLLAGLSAVAVGYEALAVLVLASCR